MECSCSVDCLVAVGKKSSVLHTTEKFYDRLRESRNNPQKMVNSPMLVADNVGDILGEAVRRKKTAMNSRSNFPSSLLAGCFGQINAILFAGHWSM